TPAATSGHTDSGGHSGPGAPGSRALSIVNPASAALCNATSCPHAGHDSRCSQSDCCESCPPHSSPAATARISSGLRWALACLAKVQSPFLRRFPRGKPFFHFFPHVRRETVDGTLHTFQSQTHGRKSCNCFRGQTLPVIQREDQPVLLRLRRQQFVHFAKQ